jgi:outer membrane protein assembly factor BamB
MLCLDKSTGTLLWGYQIPHKLLNIGGIQMETGAHSEVCAVQDDKVVFLTGQEAFALNRHSGQLLWTVFFKEDGFTSSMTVADNKVLCGSVANPTIYALSLDNGSLLWKTPTNLVSIHNIFSVKDGKIYFCDGAKLYVMDIQSGRILWSTFPPEYAQDNDATFLSSLAIGEGYMVNVGSKYVYGYQL